VVLQIRALKSEILMRQGFYEESLALDTFQLPSPFSQTDIPVWQQLTQTSDFTYLSASRTHSPPSITHTLWLPQVSRNCWEK